MRFLGIYTPSTLPHLSYIYSQQIRLLGEPTFSFFSFFVISLSGAECQVSNLAGDVLKLTLCNAKSNSNFYKMSRKAQSIQRQACIRELTDECKLSSYCRLVVNGPVVSRQVNNRTDAIASGCSVICYRT